MSLIERKYDLEAVVTAHRRARPAPPWTRLSDMEYDAIVGTVLLDANYRGAVSRELADMMLGTLDAIWTGAMDGNAPDPAALKERIDWYTARLGGQ